MTPYYQSQDGATMVYCSDVLSALRHYGNILPHPRADDEHHPSPKPPELVADLLRVTTEPGDEVLDPFMGGGPTLLAAHALGRRVTAIESVEAHCRTAVARLGAAPHPEPVASLGPLFGGA